MGDDNKYILEAYIDDIDTSDDVFDSDFVELQAAETDPYLKNEETLNTLNENDYGYKINISFQLYSGTTVKANEIHKGLFECLESISNAFTGQQFILGHIKQTSNYRGDPISKELSSEELTQRYKELYEITIYTNGYKYVRFKYFNRWIDKFKKMMNRFHKLFKSYSIWFSKTGVGFAGGFSNQTRMKFDQYVKVYNTLFDRDISKYDTDEKNNYNNSFYENIKNTFGKKVRTYGTRLAKEEYNLNMTVEDAHFKDAKLHTYLLLSITTGRKDKEYEYNRFIECIYKCVMQMLNIQIIRYTGIHIYVKTNLKFKFTKKDSPIFFEKRFQDNPYDIYYRGVEGNHNVLLTILNVSGNSYDKTQNYSWDREDNEAIKHIMKH